VKLIFSQRGVRHIARNDLEIGSVLVFYTGLEVDVRLGF